MCLYNMPDIERSAMGQRGREFYHREMSVDICVAHFERIFARVVGQSQDT